MNKTVLVIGIIFLLIGASVVSSMNTVETIQSKENNPKDNNFFNKSIMPDSFHDVGIKNITSPKVYIQPGTQSIDVIVENNGTFPEYGLTCYVEIWEYITDPINGSLVYEDNITDIDLEEPMGGTKMLNFKDFTFAYEGIYCLYVDLPLEIDDFPDNNHKELVIGVDDTKPYSWHTLDPPEPDGENGWYVNDVLVTICAEDPELVPGIPGSGFCGIYVRVNDGMSQFFSEDCITYLITRKDDKDDVKVEYWAVDSVGNVESSHTFYIDMDQTPPTLDVGYEVVGGNPIQGWELEFLVLASDATSGMDRVEFYLNGVMQENETGSGPTYSWRFRYHGGMNIVIKVIAYDKAGNNASKIIGNIKPISYNYCNQNSFLTFQFHLMTFIKNNKTL
jgi:hypothetical protein